ncbi:VCBS domain-containing protein [Pseudomonas sp. GV085]|uniref:VCBS domain-containing protein n=1 Tax=Pseudomonas sp. GV085 TaxID=2135756 RepID=UPI0026C827C4
MLSFATGNAAGAVQEDTTLSVNGQFSSADIDHDATATWSIAGTNTGTYGAIAVDSTGQWTYTLANGTNGVASAVQSLKAGESHNDVFTVQVSDGLGGVATQLVTVTVTGSNDAPVLSFATGNAAGAVQEDTTLSVNGQFSAADIDHDATATWSIAGTDTGTYGSIAVDNSGQWTYTLANGTNGVASAVQSLKAGESHNDVFTVQVSDGLGGVATQLVTVTVTGSNDAPVLSFATGNAAGAVQEDTTLSVNGQFSSADIDHDATATWSIAGTNTGTYGAIAVDSTGQWTYTLANGTDGVASAVQSLQAGESHNDVFTVQVSDGLGGVDTKLVTVTITGTNDAPTVTAAEVESATIAEDGTPLASGSFAFGDVDLADDAHVASVSAPANVLGTLLASVSDESTGDAAGSVGWTYTLNNSAAQYLAEGQTKTEVFTVTLTDDFGATVTKAVTITLTGSNDAPTVTAAEIESGAVTEDGTTVAGGSFAFGDVDLADHAHVASVSAPSGALGTLVATVSDESTGDAVGSVGWSYTLNNSAAQYLAAGQTKTEVFTVTLTDDFGATVTKAVTITLTGSNDAPVLSFATGNEAGAVQEDTTLSVSGQFSSTDIDHDATTSWTINGSPTGTYGSIAVDSTGQWTYTLANGTSGVASAVQSLKAGESHDDVFTVQVSDGLGGVDTQLVTITVTGSNDAPVLGFVTGNAAGAVQEDTTLSVNGQFSSADIDHDATATWTINGSPTGIYGSIAVDSTGQWTYTMANGTNGVASAVQSLQAGESHADVFTVQVSDGLGGVATQLVTVTVTGSNDAPVLSFATGNAAGAVQEDTMLSVSGQFSSTDIDHDATATWSIVGSNTGTYGSIAVDNSGQWIYTLANGTDGVASAVQSLQAGESHNEVFSVQVSDGLGGVDTQLVTITVTGTNDAPTVTAAEVESGAVTEDGTPLTSGSFAFGDVDLADHAHVASVSAPAGALGTLLASVSDESTGDAVGSVGWSYTLNNSAAQYLAVGQTKTEVFTVTLTDDVGAAVTKDVTITLTGTNDRPTLTITDPTGAMTEGNGAATLSDSGALSFADLDSNDSVTVSQSANHDLVWSGGTLGAAQAAALVAGFAVDQTGWTYSSSENLDFLRVGETITFSYTVVATDNSGAANAASAAQTVMITLTGTNDQPTLTITDPTGAMNEGNGAAPLSDSGALSFADLDVNDGVTVSQSANHDLVWSGGTLGAAQAAALVAGFSVDQAGWTYSSSENLDFLRAGETISFSYTVVATDNSGTGNATSAAQTVTITLTGSNDAPVLSFATGNEAGAAQEDTKLSVSGQFSSADIDHDATATWSIAGTDTGTYGSIAVDNSGKWTYTLANGSDGVASAVQSLQAGESHDEVFSVQVSDGLGGVDTQLVTITITGSNDAPVLSFATGNAAGAVQEDTTLSVNGQFSSADIDHDATATWSIAGTDTGTYGSIAVDNSGKWTYTLANGTDGVASAVQALQAGESHNEVFSVQVSDGLGGVDTQLVTITVTGNNDAPVLSFATGNEAGAVQEDTKLSVSGQFSSTDIDHNATASWTINGSPTGTYGSIAVDSTGQWTYTLANGTDGVASAVQSLQAGESHNEVFSVQVSDGLGGVDTQLVTITVTGSNDAPVLSFATGNAAGAVQEDTTLSVSGQFSAADIDHNATASWTINGSPTGTYGSIAVDSTGQWTYTLANGTDGVASAVQLLQAGESHNEVFSVQVSDGLGGVDTQLVTITVTGNNDAPVLSFATGNEAGAVQEDTKLSVSGQFSSTDIDHNATASWTINGSSTGTYGSIAVDSSGQWTYTLANGTNGVASAVQSLKAGESHNDVFSVQVSDGLGGVATQLVTITITGSNDAPVLSFATGNAAGAVQEDIKLSVSGQFSAADIDHDATATWSIAGSNTGTFGSIAVDSSGQWTYTLANGSDGVASAVQALKAGESHNDVFSVQVSDGLGGVATQLVTITITGSNDAPVLSFATGNAAGAVQEDIKLSVSGQFSAADIDHDATASWTINGSPTGTYGSIAVDSTGQWTYTLANGTNGVASAVQSLKAGESHEDVFTVQVSDGLGGVATQLVTITVTGSNDAPVLSFATGNAAGAVQEDTTLSVSGQFSSADIDHDATATWSIAGSNTGTYGAIAVDSTGQWTYTLANGTNGVASAVQSLKAGESHNDVFTVQVSDGLGGVATQLVTITVTGSNDAAVLSSASVTLSETNAPLTTGGSLTISDIDSPESFQAQTNTAGSYGKFSIGTGGAWTYVASSAHNEFAAGTTYTDTFAVSSADGTLTSVTVHILGTNDAAVLSANIANLTETNAAADISTSGTLTISDVDSAATFVAQTDIAGSYGKFSIGTGGAWTYVASSAHNEFAAGTTYTDTFAVSSADGTLTSVAVHILGTNDAAVLSSASVTLSETDAALTTGGTLTISDVDSAATFVAQTNTAGSYGQFSIGTGGAWTYVASSAHNEFATGTTYTDTFAVSSADGTLTSVTVHIAGSNDSPTITSNGGGATASINVAENTTAVTTVVATDVDLPAQTLSYNIVGGADAAKFSIVSGTGVLSFISAPNFEAPTDSGTNNVYDVIVRASDGTLFDDQAIAVTVTGVNDNSPVISSNGGGATASINVAENTTAVTTVVATDVDLPAQTLSYNIVGGADAAKFSIVSGTGVLSFISAPNFEAPTDSGTNNVYDVIVRASDGTLFDDQAIAVTVTGVNDNSPVITSNGGGATASVNVAENSTAVTTVAAIDADLPAQTLSYTILNTAGTDFSNFSISSSGVLTFNSAPDYENPQDIGGTDGDNAYVVDVQVADGNGGTDTQTITVNVQNVVETPVDTVAPTVTSITASPMLGNNDSGKITITFSEAVINFDISDFSVTAGRGTLSNFSGSGTTYTVDFTRFGNNNGNGSVKASVTNTYTDLAGNTGVAFTSSANLPAGVAGEPINLALNVPSADISGPIRVAISGVPSGWTFNAGTDNGDGTWTVQTSDPGALTVTTPSEFAGALVLGVSMFWTNADGSIGNAFVSDNVEAYATGSPIFALSADDNLTGSRDADLFVFAQPIGNNVIHSFDAAVDKIDLIGFTGVNSFADVSIANDANGNAVLSISADQTITVNGVDAAALSVANLQFDVNPVTTNTGTITIADGAIMPFGGSIDNSGTIALGSTGSGTDLEILFRGATLSGGGQVVLSDSAQNVIFGGSADTLLTNADNTISGAGQLGAGQMMLVNSGLILASGVNALVIDTGSSAVTNTGVLEATGSGGLVIESGLVNSGSLWANDGNIIIHADATGAGSATISGSAILQFAAASDQHVTFDSGAAGTLKLDVSTAFSGSVSGFAAGDTLDFGDVAFGANTQITYAANDTGTGGMLTVSDGTHVSQVALNGQYAAAGLQANAEGSGSELAYDAAAANHTMLGGQANDILLGGAGDDLFFGGLGNDTLNGGLGNDTFAFAAAGFGNDSIQGFDVNPTGGQDLLNIAGLGISSETFATSVSIAADGADTVIGIGLDSIRLVGVNSAGIDQADFILMS